jgi:hypothetical protein
MARLALPPVRRFLLWGYERGSLAYDLLFLLVLLFLLLTPRAWLADPMVR